MAVVENVRNAQDLSGCNFWGLAVDEGRRLKQRLNLFHGHEIVSKPQVGGKRPRQEQLLNNNNYPPVKRIKKSTMLPPSSSSNVMTAEALRRKLYEEIFGDAYADASSDDDNDEGYKSSIKVVGNYRTTISESEKQGNIIRKKDEEIPVNLTSSSQKQGNNVATEEIPLDLTALQKTNDKTRDKIREDFSKSLCKAANEHEAVKASASSSDPLSIAVMVETELHKAWGPCRGANKTKYLAVMFNLKNEKNPDFRKKVLLGDITPYSISRMTPEDMASDARKLENKKIREMPRFKREVLFQPEPQKD